MPPHRHVGGALRLRLRTLEGVPFSSLQGALSFDEDGFDGASPYALS